MGGAITIAVLMSLIDLQSAQAFLVQPWQQFWFCRTDGSLTHQTLGIKNMNVQSSELCCFNFTTAPFFHNCSQLESLVFAKNETCVEMLTTDLRTEDWSMEHGSSRNGDSLIAALGEKLNDASVKEKIAEYTKPPYSPAKLGPDGGSTAAMWILGVFLGVVLLSIGLLYKKRKYIRGWVDSILPSLGLGKAPGTDPSRNGYIVGEPHQPGGSP